MEFHEGCASEVGVAGRLWVAGRGFGSELEGFLVLIAFEEGFGGVRVGPVVVVVCILDEIEGAEVVLQGEGVLLEEVVAEGKVVVGAVVIGLELDQSREMGDSLGIAALRVVEAAEGVERGGMARVEGEGFAEMSLRRGFVAQEDTGLGERGQYCGAIRT